MKILKIEDLTNKQINRLDWIDVVKGLAMLCIIAGHMGIKIVNNVVFTFHVPIFFLISGYFISQKTCFKDYVIKRVKGLIIPYLFTSLLLVVDIIPVDIIKRGINNIPNDMGRVFIQALYGSGTKVNKTIMGIQQIGAIWFLLAFFWALLFVKIFIDKKYGWLWILLIAIVSYVSSQYIWLPWDIQAGGTATIFVYIGAYSKKYKIDITFSWWLILIGIVTLVLEVIFEVKVSVVSNYYKYTIVSIIGAVFISYVVLWVAMIFNSTKIIKKYLCFVGADSIIFLCFHLVELNNAPWWILYSVLGGISPIIQYSICFACKLLFITICTMVALKIKWLRIVFSK